MKRAVTWQALVGLASSMLACCEINLCSDDHPGYCDDINTTFQAQTVSRWTVDDSATNERLAAGCDTRASVPAVPGQLLRVELWDEPSSVSSTVDLEMPEGFWCSDNKRISRTPDISVPSLSCWRVPQEGEFGSAAEVLEQKVLPPDREPGDSWIPHLVAGRGYSFLLKVLSGGSVVLQSSELCGRADGGGGRSYPTSPMRIVEIECGPKTPCPDEQVCAGTDCILRTAP